MQQKKLILPVFLFLFSVNFFAQDNLNTGKPISAKFLVEAGINYGGDEILEVFFTNGENQKMRAGQGGFIALGGEFQFSKIEPLALRATLGFKYNTTAADDANIKLTRVPINIVAFWKLNEDFRIGVGGTTHQNVSFDGDGFFSDVDFTSSFGPRFELGYKWFAITYEIINYKDEMNLEISANSIGLSASFTFPN